MTKRNPQREDTRLVAIRAAIGPVLAAHTVELGDLGWFREPAGLTLRLTIERPLPAGELWRPERGFGVNLDDCAAVSREVSTVLDALEAEGDLPEGYLLEVSSPGLDRPLHGAGDFVRFRGALAKVKLASPAPDGQRVLRGLIEGAADGLLVMVVDGKRFEVSLDDVVEANLVFELPSMPKGAAKAAGPRAPGAKPAGAKAPGAKASRAADVKTAPLKSAGPKATGAKAEAVETAAKASRKGALRHAG